MLDSLKKIFDFFLHLSQRYRLKAPRRSIKFFICSEVIKIIVKLNNLIVLKYYINYIYNDEVYFGLFYDWFGFRANFEK